VGDWKREKNALIEISDVFTFGKHRHGIRLMETAADECGWLWELKCISYLIKVPPALITFVTDLSRPAIVY
jgi:hypothetical protein